MTNEEMKNELKENGIYDNPFDDMVYNGLEIARDLLFGCHRVKNPDIPESITVNQEKLEKRMEIILSELNKVLSVTSDTAKMLRETSYYFNHESFEQANEILLKMEKKMPTKWTREIPAYNDTFEKIRLGEDSSEYKRILELRDLISGESLLAHASREYLHSLIDVIERPDDCTKYWMTEREFNEKKTIIELYKLTVDDIRYMVSYASNEFDSNQ